MAGPVFDQVLIGGRWVPAAGGTYPVVNPATEEIAGHAPACSVAQVEAVARAARDAFERGPWRTMSGGERAALLRIAAERFQGEMDGLVELTIAETGAVRAVAEAQQVRAVAGRLLRAAELATAPFEQGLPPRETGRALAAGVIVREAVARRPARRGGALSHRRRGAAARRRELRERRGGRDRRGARALARRRHD